MPLVVTRGLQGPLEGRNVHRGFACLWDKREKIETERGEGKKRMEGSPIKRPLVGLRLVAMVTR